VLGLRTFLCWVVAYFSTFYFFTRGLVCRGVDASRTLRGHFHEGSRQWAKLLLWLTGIRVTCRNPEALDAAARAGRPWIVASNHQSIVDILALLDVIPFQFAFFAKRSLFFAPVAGWYLWMAGYIPVNRQDPRSAYRSIEAAAERISRGVSLVIFPEGSRSDDGSLGRFKNGFVRVAEMSGAAILPVAIAGSHRAVPKGSMAMNPTEVVITVGTPIEITPEKLANRDERSLVVDSVRTSIATMLEEAAPWA